jgi:hypothetical protein
VGVRVDEQREVMRSTGCVRSGAIKEKEGEETRRRCRDEVAHEIDRRSMGGRGEVALEINMNGT